jgi:selenide,water dikinase
MQHPLPLTRDLVLIGGGHTHALVLKMWGMRPLPGTRLTLIDPAPTTAYTGMLPGFVAGHYSRDDLDIDLVRLARFAGARIIVAPVTGLDPDTQRLEIEGRAPIRYDIASLDIGATGRVPDIPGFADHVATAKPLADFADRWTEFTEGLKAGTATPKVAVIGAGAAGAELALAADHRLKSLGHNPEITLIEARDAIAPELAGAARRLLVRALEKAGIATRTRATVKAVSADGLCLVDGEIEAEFVIGAAGVEPWPWVKGTGLALEDGWVRVDQSLRSISHPTLFAAGDCAHLDMTPRPKAGVFAVRAAPVLAENLRDVLQARRPGKRFKPQRDYLKLISTGSRAAIAEKHGLAIAAPALWTLKDRIDGAFMERLSALELMAPERVGGAMADGVQALTEKAQPLCGGCGSKTGRAALDEGLKTLTAPRNPDIMTGAGDDAAILKAGRQQQVLTTDHVRAFVDDPGLFARIAAVHALGDVWASGARPQAALATLILPPLSDTLQSAMVAEIIAAAQSVFTKAGADIVGGHTSTGGELSLGFTVTGTTKNAIGQGGAQPGDYLVLTKPIGTGVILAAEMQLKARGRDAAACWNAMARPQDRAASLLAPVATAMTDVTGFGLAGHLSTLLGEAGAELRLDDIPLLDGALSLAEAGVRSTLFNANQLGADRLDAPRGALTDLLVDPQTAGGLLASIPERKLETLFAAFETAAEPIWTVGRVLARDDAAAQIKAR